MPPTDLPARRNDEQNGKSHCHYYSFHGFSSRVFGFRHKSNTSKPFLIWKAGVCTHDPTGKSHSFPFSWTIFSNFPIKTHFLSLLSVRFPVAIPTQKKCVVRFLRPVFAKASTVVPLVRDCCFNGRLYKRLYPNFRLSCGESKRLYFPIAAPM